MELAIVAGAAPKGATKKTHGAIRSIFKGLMLGTNYGQGADAFAEIAGISKVRARAILQTHKNYFHRYWQWIENFKDYTMETHYAYTPLGWRICTDNQSRRSMQNWPMQSTGTDILHVAVLLLRENNIKVCATVHDAVLIESGIDTIDIDTRKTQLIMAEAANQVIGYPIAADAQIVKYPDHFVEDRGTTMWNLVQELLRDRE